MGAKEEDLYMIQKHAVSQGGVGIFGLIFLSHFLTKMRSFCAHQKGNSLNLSKITLLLSIVQFWYPLWPVKHKGAFFLRHPVLTDGISMLQTREEEVPAGSSSLLQSLIGLSPLTTLFILDCL